MKTLVYPPPHALVCPVLMGITGYTCTCLLKGSYGITLSCTDTKLMAFVMYQIEYIKEPFHCFFI